MSASVRSRTSEHHEDSDEWLIDAARRAGHALPHRERPPGTSAWRLLLNVGVPEDEIMRVASAASGTEAADLSRVSPALGAFLPHAIALRFRVAPLGVRNGVLRVATYNPRSTLLERELAFASKHRVSLHAASPAAILRAQGAIYGTVYGTSSSAADPHVEADAVPAPRLSRVARLSQAVPEPADAHGHSTTLADRMLITAVTERASEVHLVPAQEGGLLIRLRVDGTISDRFGVSEANAARIVRALKTRAGLRVDDARHPQSGPASFTSPQGTVTLRVSTEPLPGGLEHVVVRLQGPHPTPRIAELGLSMVERRRFEELLAVRHGLVLVVGPRDSGKTTALYAALRDLVKHGRHAASVEEPVERQLDGVEQTDVGASAFATLGDAALARLNGSADAVYVSTLEDAATAHAVVTSGNGRCLVLASLDATDLGSAVERMYELEADTAGLSTALQGVVALRLLRRLCAACAAPQHLTELPEQQQRLLSGLPSARLRRAVGCEHCRGTGYTGRTAVAEVVPITPELRAAIARRAAAPALAQLARECGINNLWDSGMTAVVEGTSCLSELLDHVIPPPEVADGTVAQQDIDALLAQLLGGARSEASVVEPVEAPTAPLRVLVVDDDALSRRALAKELTDAGMRVIEAADGVAGLAYARQLRPDFIVSDVAIPRLDVVGLMEALAKDDASPPVLVHTAQLDEALLQWLRKAGAVGVVLRGGALGAVAKRLHELQAAIAAAPGERSGAVPPPRG